MLVYRDGVIILAIMTLLKTEEKYGGKKGKKYPHLQRAKIKNCVICGDEFRAVKDSKNYQQKYCGKECWNKRGEHHRLVCTNCGKVGLPMTARKYCSRECAYKNKIKEKHPQWKGEDASYSAIHKYLTATYGKPKRCEECGLKPNNKADIHWANMTGEYTRNKKDYKPLCRWCHMKHDGNDIRSNGGRWGNGV